MIKTYSFFFLLICLFLLSNLSIGQPKNYDYRADGGFKFSLLANSTIAGNLAITNTDLGFSTTVQPIVGTSFGAVLRYHLNNQIDIETGVYQNSRIFELNSKDDSMQKEFSERVRFNNYEIPINGVIHVRVSEKLYLNAHGGISTLLYPSNIRSNIDENYKHTSFRKRWIQAGLNIGTGLELRDKKNGTIYLGTSYQLLTESMTVSEVEYLRNSTISRVITELPGNFLSFDVKYFIPQKPKKTIDIL